MSKKQKISDKLQSKFNKPQFQIGDAVFFSWLGQKQYGHVKKTKQVSWGTQYTVESTSGVKYPCGIQIQGQKTNYNTGYILFEDTRTIGSAELTRRIENIINEPRVTKVFRNTPRPANESRDNDSSSRTDATNNSIKDTSNKTRRSSKSNVNASSSRGNGIVDTTKRKNSRNTELDTAIQKQRDFLNGFVKKD